MSGAETTGNESKEGFRAWSIWRHYTAVHYANGSFEHEDTALFIVVGENNTNMALISGFGLHGGAFKGLDIRYIMPHNLFKVPVIRELLLWSGAICANKDVNGAILNLLRKGKSVAYCPPATDEELVLDKGLFEFATKNDIKLVPVVVSGESDRYNIYRPELVRKMQRFFAKKLGYPFPLIFCPRSFGPSPPPKIEIAIGVPMNPAVQQTPDTFYSLFHSQIKAMKP